MNSKTIGIFSVASLLGLASLGFVSQNPAPQPLSNIPQNVPQKALTQPQALVQFGQSPVQATARISQSLLRAGQENEVFVDVSVQADYLQNQARSVATVLLIDSSGSMSGQKIRAARQAANAYIDRLSDRDLVGIISYSSRARVMISMQPAGMVRERAKRQLRNLYAGGGTNISAGLNQAIQMLAGVQQAKRVLLISDGRPTEGSRSTQVLANIAANGRQQGLSFSSIGVGVDYDEDVMERIALRGGGNFYHLAQTYALNNILRQEFASMKSLAASQLALRLMPANAVHIEEVYGYEIDQLGRSRRVDLGDLSSGEQRHVVIRLRAFAQREPRVNELLQMSLSFVRPGDQRLVQSMASLSFASTAQRKLAQASQDAQVLVASSKAQAASALRESMQDLAHNRKGGALAKLKNMGVQLRAAAKRAPAASAPAMEAQAAMLDDMQEKTEDADMSTGRGRGFAKKARAQAFGALH